MNPAVHKKLSIVIPVYNEGGTIHEIIDRVVLAPIPQGMSREIICVNDCSKDDTAAALDRLPPKYPDVPFQIFHKPVNEGKGAAVRDGFKRATGDIVLIQDADLEYDPNDYMKLVSPITEGKADVVYGSRFIGEPHRVLYYWHSLGNKFLTTFSNMFTNLNLTDMETCYKVFRREVIQRIVIEENRFGFEPEITAKVAKLDCRIYEVGIGYDGRTYKDGKKIGWKDGVRALWCIWKYGVLRR